MKTLNDTSTGILGTKNYSTTINLDNDEQLDSIAEDTQHQINPQIDTSLAKVKHMAKRTPTSKINDKSDNSRGGASSSMFSKKSPAFL